MHCRTALRGFDGGKNGGIKPSTGTLHHSLHGKSVWFLMLQGWAEWDSENLHSFVSLEEQKTP